MSVQQSAQDPVTGRFRPGNNANPAGRMTKAERQARIQATARRLAREFGGLSKLSAIDRVRIEQVAVLLERKPRSHEDRTRAVNAINRLLASVERRAGRREAPSDEFGRILDGGRP